MSIDTRSDAWYPSADSLVARLIASKGQAWISLKSVSAPRTREFTRSEPDRNDATRVATVNVHAALPAADARAGIRALADRGIIPLAYFSAFGAALVTIEPEVALAVRDLPFVDLLEPVPTAPIHLAGTSRRAAAPMSPSLWASRRRRLVQTTPWGISMVRAPQAWSLTRGATAKIMVIDQGLDAGHPDLPVPPPSNCLGNVVPGCDSHIFSLAHGTIMTGIIAEHDNSEGYVGVAPGIADADVYEWGACDENGFCSNVDLVAAYQWAATHLAAQNAVLNLSFEHLGIDAQEQSIIGNLIHNDISLVSARGDGAGTTVVYPAGYSGVISVSGVQSNKDFAGTTYCGTAVSSWGDSTTVSAPFDAMSAYPPSTYTPGPLCGTSTSAAHVTGVVALMRAYHPGWKTYQITDNLRATAEHLRYPDKNVSVEMRYDLHYGQGVVRADFAIGLWSPEFRNPTIIGGRPRFSWETIPLAATYELKKWKVNISGAPGEHVFNTVTGTTFTDCEPVSALIGVNTLPSVGVPGIVYRVRPFSADGVVPGAGQYFVSYKLQNAQPGDC